MAGVPMMVSVEVSVATMEKASAHQGAVRPPRKYSRPTAVVSPDAAETHAQRCYTEQISNDNGQVQRMDAHRREIICSAGCQPDRFLCAVAERFSDWVGPDGGGAVGRSVGEYGGDEEGGLCMGPGTARAGKRAFVKVARRGERIVGEFKGIQFCAHRRDGLAVV